MTSFPPSDVVSEIIFGSICSRSLWTRLLKWFEIKKVPFLCISLRWDVVLCKSVSESVTKWWLHRSGASTHCVSWISWNCKKGMEFFLKEHFYFWYKPGTVWLIIMQHCSYLGCPCQVCKHNKARRLLRGRTISRLHKFIQNNFGQLREHLGRTLLGFRSFLFFRMVRN